MRIFTALFLLGLLLVGAAVPVRAANDILSIIRGDYERRQQRTMYPNSFSPAQQRPRPIKPRIPRPVPPPQPAAATTAATVTNFISVLGDQMADSLADGITEQLKDRQDVSVTSRTRPTWGVARSDWSEAVTERLALADRIDAAVIMVGVNDRQPIVDGTRSVSPDKPEWRGLYTKRVDALLNQFKARNIQVFWVGLPPMRDRQLNASVVLLNEIYRERVERIGGTYVDIWTAFADEDGAFEVSGPDLTGQPAKLRMGDGIRFTKAGANLAAHYVEKDLRSALLDSVEPDPGSQDFVNPTADAGAIRKLSNVELSPGGVLLGMNRPLAPVASAGSDALVAPAVEASVASKVFLRGEPLTPKPGRSDDYTWPPTSMELKTSRRNAELPTSTQ